MGLKEDYIFWSMVKELTARYGYRMITISDNHDEIWLENGRNQRFPVIRLMRVNLDWANWLKRDIERTALNGEQIRRKLIRKPLNVFNIYVTSFAPVDDYEYLISSPSISNKTTIHTFILDTSRFENKFMELQGKLEKQFHFKFSEGEGIEEAEIVYLKQTALSASVQKAKEEQQLFSAGKPFFTYLFIVLQVAVFLLMELNGGSTNSSTLIEFGAKYNPLILQGEWWRFFTPIIVHIGFLHLLMNTMSLYFLGGEVERIYGRLRFFFIYLFAGFAGVLASFLTNANISAGASGAIFGCFGALLYFGIAHPKLFFRTMGMNVIILILFNLGYGFSVEGIDNAGHIGGLIGGFLAAGIVHLPKSKQPVRQIAFALAAVFVTYWLLQMGFSSVALDGNDRQTAHIAQKYLDEDQVDKAQELLEKFTEKHQNAPYSYFVLGNLESHRGNFEAAEKHYLQSIKYNPDFSASHYNLALVYMDAGQPKRAEVHAKKAAEISPDEERYQKLLEQLRQRGEGSL
ncbi:rhomboid family intramembrane serine protease [Bacillus sp. V5-8f]|uniref:rhomboid family intramembrane serine protease n=1 Tax=Bacillus sp. V5-8f TaxID=2053044 RepID=UPI000CAC6146|nr:rhomboid family intramembrane serine protease [Bacillus sp. V5-8f]PLT34709.1 rhomboid family intramembrane serine protease [Bacillus sp. V5-8f]